MNIAELLANIASYRGQVVTLEGDFVVTQEGNAQIARLTTSHDVADVKRQQILIQQSLPELRKIIQPLPTVQLVYRGVMTNPPYMYRFPAQITALVELDVNGLSSLNRITGFEAMFPFAGKLGEKVGLSEYVYRAEVTYDSHEQAKVNTERTLISPVDTGIVIDESDYRYVRPLIQQIITVRGWFDYLVDAHEDYHYVFETLAIRSSLLNWGQREMTGIWLRPAPIYELLRAYHPHHASRFPVQITGVLDYVRDEMTLPSIASISSLAWTEITGITLYETIVF